MRVLLGWALALLASGRALWAQAPAWVAAGPASLVSSALGGAAVAGPITALAAAAAPSTSVYAAGVGGVWCFNPAAGIWTAISGGAAVASLAVDGGNLYAGTGDAITPGVGQAGTGILLSTDGGGHWTTLGQAALAGLAVTRILVDPQQAGHLWAVAALVPDSPTGAQPGLYASSDGGTSWTLELSGQVWDAAFDPSTGEVLVAVGTALELAPGGVPPFVSLVLGSASPSGRVALAANPGGGFLAFWLGSQPALAAISASGSLSSLPLPASVISSLATGATTGLALAAHAGQIWIGAADLWMTSNAGQSWTPESAGLPVASQQHAVAWDNAGNLWLGNDGGTWQAPSGGALQDANTGLNNFAPTALTLTGSGGPAAFASFAGDSDGSGSGSLQTTAGWSTDGTHRLALLASSGATVNTIYAVPRATAQVISSSDGGQSWSSNLAPPTLAGTITALAANGGELWLGTSGGEVWGSSDGGAQWQQLPALPSNTATVAALAASATSLWLAAGASLWMSADGGQTWTAMPAPGGAITALAAAPSHAGSVAAATTQGAEVLVAGAWQALPAPTAPVTALVWDATDTLWAATLGRGFQSMALSQLALAVTLTPASASVTAGGSVNLTVQLSDVSGPAAGVTVTISSSSGWSTKVTTNSQGTATAAFTVPQQAGSVGLQAAATGAWGTASAAAQLAVTPGPLTRIEVVAGAGASGFAGTTLELVLASQDQYGNAIAGVPLAFSGAGTFSPVAPTTGANGQASVAYTLPPTPGTVALSASAGSVQTSWSETVLPPPSYTLVLTPPSAPVPPGQGSVSVEVQVVPGAGGYTAPVVFQGCQPAPGCSFSAPSVSPPYPPVTLTVDLAARTASQSALPVTVTTDALHTQPATIPLQGFTFTASASSLNVTAGQTSPAVVLTLTPVNGMAGSVSLAATPADTALPSWLVPVFTPGAVSLPAVSTASFAVSTAQASSAGGGWPPWTWLPPLVLWALAKRRRRRWGRLGCVAALALASVACGGGGGSTVAPPPPPPAPTVSSYTLQLTATAGVLHASLPVQVTVTSR